MSGLKPAGKRRTGRGRRRARPTLWDRALGVFTVGLVPTFGLLFFWTGLTTVKFQSTLGPARTGHITRIDYGASYSRLHCGDETLFLSDGGPGLRISDCDRGSEAVRQLAHGAYAAGVVVQLRANQDGRVMVLTTPTDALDARASYDRRQRTWAWPMLLLGGLMLALSGGVLTRFALERRGLTTLPLIKPEPPAKGSGRPRGLRARPRSPPE